MPVGYYSKEQAQDAVVAAGLGAAGLDGVRVVWHDEKIVPNADPDKGVVNLPRLACAEGFTQEELTVLRGNTDHEIGHCKESVGVSRRQWPKGPLFGIWNAIEDRRMERAFSKEWPGIRSTFRDALGIANRKIGGNILDGKEYPPLWEALAAMSFQSEGEAPTWKLTDKADHYYQAGYATFSEWRECETARDALDLAKRLHAVLNQANKDWQEKQDDGQGQGSGDGEDERDGQDGQPGEKKSDDSDGEGGQDAGGQDAGEPAGESDEEGDKDAGDGSGAGGSKELDDDGDDSGDSEDGQSGGGGSDDDGDGQGDGASGGGEPDEGGEPDRHDGAEGHGGGGRGPGGGHRDELPDDEDVDRGLTPEDVERAIAEDMDGDNPIDLVKGEIVVEAMERVERDAWSSGASPYTALRHTDEHTVPAGDRDEFMALRKSIQTSVFALTRMLEQALRAMASCRRLRGKRSGRLDATRLVHVAKSLSRDVFERKRLGSKLDTAVVLVIDESGSMWACREIGKVVAAMGEAMSACNIPFEIVGATTKYSGGARRCPCLDGFTRTNPVVYMHYKSFGERWAGVAHRIVEIAARKHHIDGEVVEHGAARLLGRRESRKVVISLSDGDPCGGQGNDRELASNLVRVCKRAREAGVEVYSLSIDTTTPARYYGKENSVVMKKGDDFGKEFARNFVKILTDGRLKVAGV